VKVNLSHCIKQLPPGPHRVVLEQFEQHLRGVIAGEHTLEELADLYCLPARQDKGGES
jgi:hypothetical protein